MNVQRFSKYERTPKISIGVVRSRFSKKIHEWWFRELERSVWAQDFDEIELIVAQNTEGHTIGKATNALIDAVRSPFVLLIDDDDSLANEWAIGKYYDELLFLEKEPVLFTGMVRTINDIQPLEDYWNGRGGVARRWIWKGIWQKSYLKDQPFREDLEKGVDIEAQNRAISKGYPTHYIEDHSYAYRLHEQQSSRKDGIISN